MILGEINEKYACVARCVFEDKVKSSTSLFIITFRIFNYYVNILIYVKHHGHFMHRQNKYNTKK